LAAGFFGVFVSFVAAFFDPQQAIFRPPGQ